VATPPPLFGSPSFLSCSVFSTRAGSPGVFYSTARTRTIFSQDPCHSPFALLSLFFLSSRRCQEVPVKGGEGGERLLTGPTSFPFVLIASRFSGDSGTSQVPLSCPCYLARTLFLSFLTSIPVFSRSYYRLVVAGADPDLIETRVFRPSFLVSQYVLFVPFLLPI